MAHSYLEIVNTFPLAAIDGPEVLIPLVAVVLMFGLPIIAVLTAHQRKMAELLHQNHNIAQNPDMAALRMDMQRMNDKINQLTVMMDQSRPHSHLSATPPQIPTVDAHLQSRIDQ